jgi:hydrogenase-1 operon protein HyaE
MNTLSDSPAPLMQRLVRECHAQWLDPSSIKDWTAAGGDRVLLLAGDPVRFPEGQDVAAVLPELYKSLPGRFSVGIVAREHEDEIAQRYGSQRWPTLLFFRDGGYVSALAGMHDWDVFLQKVVDCLQMPVVRAPTIGIPVVSAPTGSGCQA